MAAESSSRESVKAEVLLVRSAADPNQFEAYVPGSEWAWPLKHKEIYSWTVDEDVGTLERWDAFDCFLPRSNPCFRLSGECGAGTHHWLGVARPVDQKEARSSWESAAAKGSASAAYHLLLTGSKPVVQFVFDVTRSTACKAQCWVARGAGAEDNVERAMVVRASGFLIAAC
jgi:hypothetical protein